MEFLVRIVLFPQNVMIMMHSTVMQ